MSLRETQQRYGDLTKLGLSAKDAMDYALAERYGSSSVTDEIENRHPLLKTKQVK
jgi:hypothetical protein